MLYFDNYLGFMEPNKSHVYDSMTNHSNSAPHLKEWISIPTIVSCAFSVIGSLIQIVAYYMCKQLRTPSRKLLVFMSVADLSSAVALGVGAVKDFDNTSDWCVAQAFFSTFFSTSSMFWMVALLIYLLVTVITIDPERSESLVSYFHTVCWGVPGLMSFLALSFKGLGSTHSRVSVGWCWINVDNSQALFWMLVTEKLWEFASFFCLVIFSIGIRIQTSRKCSNEDLDYLPFGTAEAMRKINQKVLFIPLIFILLRIGGIIRFFLFVRKSSHSMNGALMVLQGIGSTGQGFANLILFCICTSRTREIMLSELADIFNRDISMKKMIPCRKCCLTSAHIETKPLLQEQNQQRKKDLYVYFKGYGYNYTGSQSLSQAAQLSYSHIK